MEGDKNEEVSQCEEKLKQVNEMNTRSTDAVSFKMKKRNFEKFCTLNIFETFLLKPDAHN